MYHDRSNRYENEIQPKQSAGSQEFNLSETFLKSKKRQLAVTVHFSKRAQLFFLSDKIVFPPPPAYAAKAGILLSALDFYCVLFLSLVVSLLLLTKKDFDLQVNSLGRGYLLLTLWHQNLTISVQKGNKLTVMQFAFPLPITKTGYWHKPLKV